MRCAFKLMEFAFVFRHGVGPKGAGHQEVTRWGCMQSRRAEFLVVCCLYKRGGAEEGKLREPEQGPGLGGMLENGSMRDDREEGLESGGGGRRERADADGVR